MSSKLYNSCYYKHSDKVNNGKGKHNKGKNEVKKGKIRNISGQEVAKEIKDMFFRLINIIRLLIKSVAYKK